MSLKVYWRWLAQILNKSGAESCFPKTGLRCDIISSMVNKKRIELTHLAYTVCSRDFRSLGIYTGEATVLLSVVRRTRSRYEVTDGIVKPQTYVSNSVD